MTRRSLTPLCAVAALACYDTSNPIPPLLVVNPILDSLYVGDALLPRTVILLDSYLQPHDPGPVTWTVDADTAATIDADGTIHGVGRGEAVIIAHAAGLTGRGLVIVSRPLDLTLLMDTVLLMQDDTFTIPLAIQAKNPLPPDSVWFDRSPDVNRYTIDTTNGFVTAQATGVVVRYVAHVTNGTVTVADTGAVWVIPTISATGGGRFFMTVVGTAIRHEGGEAYAMNYTRTNGKRAFRLTDSLISANSTRYERLMITLPDSVIATRMVAIDSINPQETSGSIGTLNAICNPPRPWGLWSSVLPTPGIRAYSNLVYSPSAPATDSTGYLSVRYQPVSGGFVIGGRFVFTARRTDLYYDPLGLVTIHGTFVAPLVDNTATCQR